MNLFEIDGVRYEITEQLSTQGQQGEVKRGINIFTNEEVIIKAMNSFEEHEINVLNILKKYQPLYNIIQIKGYQIQEKKLIIVMEHGGQDLQNFLRDNYKKLGKQQLMSIFFQIVSAVKQFHDLGFLHRDLKPANFTINKNNFIKLIDFGTSKIYSSERLQSSHVGTQQYSAPEISSGVYNKSIDIWSLGCILFELLTQEAFYKNKKLDIQNQGQIYQRIEQQKLLEDPEKELLKNLLQVDPSKRYDTQQILNYLQRINVQQQIQFPQKKIFNIQTMSYEVIETIERGKNFKTYKGICSTTGEYMVIKTLKTISEFEYQLLSTLKTKQSEHIVQIMSLFKKNNGKVFIVMEIGDYNLLQYINENEFKTLQKYSKNRIFQQMVLAVNELHELGYFHKELKLRDFIVFKKDQFGNIKIKLIAREFLSIKEAQTTEMFQYKAPEQLEQLEQFGTKFFDKTVDYWALGCIWFELISGQKLFQGNSIKELTHKIIYSTQEEINFRIQSEKSFAENEKYLLQRMIHKDRNRRPNKEEIKQFLNPIISQSMIKQSLQGSFFKQFSQQQGKNASIQFQATLEQKNFISQVQKIKQEQEQTKIQQINNFVEKQKLISRDRVIQKTIEIEKRNETENSGKIDSSQRIEQELIIQNEIEIFKQSIEEEQKIQKDEFEEKLQKQQNDDLTRILEEQKYELQKNLEQEQRNELIIQCNQSDEEKQKEQEQEQKRFIEMKNNVLQLIQCTKELVQGFLLNFEQQGLVKNDNSNLGNEYKSSLQKYRNLNSQKFESIKQDEILLKKVNDINEMEIIQNFEKKYNEDLASLTMQQANIQKEIDEKFQQFQKQQKKQEDDFNHTNNQIQKQQQDCEKIFLAIEEYSKKLGLEQFLRQYNQAIQLWEIIKLQSNHLSQQQELEGKIVQYQQLINQQHKISRELICLVEAQKILLKEYEEYNNDLRQKEEDQAKQFEEQLQNFTQKIQKYKNEGKKPHQALFQRMENRIEQCRNQLEDFSSFLNQNQILISEQIEIQSDDIQTILQEIDNIDYQIIQYLEEEAVNHFKMKLSDFEQLLMTFNFDPNFKLYVQIVQQKNHKQEQLKQIENYFKKCFDYYDEDQKLYNDFKIKLKTKEKFQSMRDEIQNKIEKKFKLSQKYLEGLQNLYRQFNSQKEKINFEGDDIGYRKVVESWEAYQLTQKNGKELAESTNALLYQRSKNQSSQPDDFSSQINFRSQQLDQFIQDLKSIDQGLIQQYNQWIQTNNNSLIIATLIILIIQLYQTKIYHERINYFEQNRKKQDLKKSQIREDNYKNVQNSLLSYQDILQKNQLQDLDIDCLEAKLNIYFEDREKVLKTINDKNKLRLKVLLKDQQIIKDIIDLSPYQEFCSIKIHQIMKKKK